MQSKVEEFNKKNRGSEPLEVAARLMDIQSEMGELAKEFLKATDYGSKDFVLTHDFELELGDVLYSIYSLACELGINSDEAVQKVLDKYQKRIDEKANMGSGR